jgi:outer membrane protein OmpA-like peptidoglycan-associated protein
MRNFFCICLFIGLTVFLNAQTAAELDKLLGRKVLSYEESVPFVFEAADVPQRFGPGLASSPAEAFRFAKEQRWLPGNVNGSDQAALEGVSLLIMRAFNIKGGIFYSLLKSPHYAYRELVYQNIIQGRSDPQMAVSGDFLVFMVNRVLARTDSEYRALAPELTKERPAAKERNNKEEEWQALAEDISTKLRVRAVTGTNVKITKEGVTISLINLQFLPNSAELADVKELRDFVEILKSVPSRRIKVSGHSALAGTLQDQQRTSRERAQAMADYLIQAGPWKASDIIVQAYGAEQPIADNTTPEGMAHNRRVEITLLD